MAIGAGAKSQTIRKPQQPKIRMAIFPIPAEVKHGNSDPIVN
jgi:hypothetical protein